VSEVLNFNDLINGWNDSRDSNISNSTDASPPLAASGSVEDAITRRMVRAMNAEQATVQLANTGSWQSALHLAARGGHTNIVRMIMQHKVDINISDGEGQTPLMYAVAEGREEVVLCLLASGACLGRSDATGRTALHLAAKHRQLAVLRIILNQNGGKLHPFLNFYDSKGRTPLHVAVEVGFEEGVEVLLQSGASLQLNCSKVLDQGPVLSTFASSSASSSSGSRPIL
jgi:ankyrin repeat protein